MRTTRQMQGDLPGLDDFLWGAAHALDLGGVLLAEADWDGPEADADAIAGDWRASLATVDREIADGETDR
jgi:hypothetical protein